MHSISSRKWGQGACTENTPLSSKARGGSGKCSFKIPMGRLSPQGLQTGPHLKTGPWTRPLRALKTPSLLPSDWAPATGRAGGGDQLQPSSWGEGRAGGRRSVWLAIPAGTKIKFWELAIVIRNIDHSVKLDYLF